MAFSIQTNVNAMTGQENLRLNQDFQSRTINRLTSGYRITSSADDAAGLSVANKYRNSVTELQQGVRNANDGTSTLQIVDGGLNNISKILDRMTTLATQAATDTFTGDRAILNTEYQSLLTEINRQAANIGLSTGNEGGRNNKNIGVYIGGGEGVQANAKVQIDLSGASNRVNSSDLGISTTSITGGGNNELTSNVIDLSAGGALADSSQTFTLRLAGSTVTATVNNIGGSGMSATAVLEQLNDQFAGVGVSASLSSNGELQFSSSNAFTVLTGAVVGSGTAAATAASSGTNTAMYSSSGQTPFVTVAGSAEVITFIDAAGNTEAVTLAVASTRATALTQLNAELNDNGIYAVENAAGTGIDFQSSGTFTVTSSGGGVTGVYATNTGAAQTVTAPAASATQTGNALLALTSLSSAVTSLSEVSGKVGTGLNKLQYAVQLAQSQISNFSAAESRIRDADIAMEAANLTKAQVLQQASMAAMAQANSAPQSILALLRG